ncbi:GTP cyclohydrolase I FolE [Mycobacterium sp. 3519A]|uniref:GTP cyclohydrolase I FolE n=1 Tax=Mycobacterium sp. 3519A TaxID=2057184 RepID=UPI000C7DE4E4
MLCYELTRIFEKCFAQQTIICCVPWCCEGVIVLQSREVSQTPHVKLKAARTFDQAGVEAAIFDLLVAIGEDPHRDGLKDTPARVARAYRETFAGLYTDPEDVLSTVFDEQHGELVLVKQIPMYSTCEHHLVSFHGVAHVGYLPGADGRVTGLSKIARLVDLYARRPQVQERLTGQIADAFMRKMNPRGVIVVIEAEHLCMAMRGVRKPGAVTTTSAVRGQFATDAAPRAEALHLLRE